MLAGLCTVAACSFGGALSGQAIDYNETVSVASNAILVRNILRSRDNAPVHYTAVSQIRGGVSAGLMSTLGLPFGRYFLSPQSSNTLDLNASTSVSPTFDVASLDTQDFTQGLLTPIEPELFKYFWDRGFPRQMLLYLMVDKVETLDKTYPNSARDHQRFKELVDSWTVGDDEARKFEVLDVKTVTPIGPERSEAEANRPELLAAINSKDSGLSLQSKPRNRWQLVRETPSIAFCAPNAGSNSPAARSLLIARPGSGPAVAGGSCQSRTGSGPGAESGAGEMTIQLRSVDQMIYYLGQAQAAAEKGDPVRIRVRTRTEKNPPEAYLFRLTSRPSGADMFSVEYRGERFYVPRAGVDGETVGDETLQVLSLLTHLLNLKKRADALPTTRAVQVVR